MMLVLLAALSATPSASSLADGGGLRGYLVRPVQFGGEAQLEKPLSQMTRDELRVEYRRLEDNRPGIGGQITMIALGGATLAVGALTTWFSLILSIGISGSVPIVPLVIGIGLIVGGGALLTLGIIMLRLAINERRPFNEAMDEVKQRLDGNYEEPGRPPPVPNVPYEPNVPPPPPPPPPPGAGWPDVRPSLVLATF